MFKERLAEFSNLLEHVGLQKRLVWKRPSGELTLGYEAGCVLAGVDVAHSFRRPAEGHKEPPVPSDEVIDAIKAVLETDDLEVERIGATDEIWGCIIEMTALRYTAKH
jgi:hypothetical protein